MQECEQRLAASVERLTACTDELATLKSSSQTKQDELLGRVDVLEKEEKKLRAVVESERKSCSTKLQGLEDTLERQRRGNKQLESALKELEELKSAWLPVWMSDHVEKARPVLSKARPYAAKVFRSAKFVWRKSVLPLASKGNKVAKNILSKAVRDMGRAWEKHVPTNYRALVSSYMHKGHKAVVLSLGTAKVYYRFIKSQLVIIVGEISTMVTSLADTYPEQFGWAKGYSGAIAVFMLSSPITFVGMPILASRLQSRRTPSSKKKNSKKNSKKKKSSK